MKTLYAAIGALALASTAASAEPVTRNTITGYAASVAVARGVPLDGRKADLVNVGYRAAVAGGGSSASKTAVRGEAAHGVFQVRDQD